MSFPGSIADRTSFLEGKPVANPAYGIASIIKKLECAGAEVIGIACNTSHAPRIYNIVTSELEHSNLKLVNMPYETCRFIKENYPRVNRVGVLSTNGTYLSGVYEELLLEMGYEPVMPDRSFQNAVIHRMVYDPVFGIKSTARITDEVTLLMEDALSFFRDKKADAIILGCTEFSLVPIGSNTNGMVVIDSTEVLAMALIREAASMDSQSNIAVYKMQPGGLLF
jgi:aspartate racemase